MSLKILATIPAYNEEKYISSIVNHTKKYVDDIIVVDDGSTDKTADNAEESGAKVIKHKSNKGYGESIKTCFNAAKVGNYDILVTIDGDGQHNPEEIPRLLEPILSGEADLVIGSRFIKKLKVTDHQNTNYSNVPAYRRFGIGVITFLFNFWSKTKITDAQSGFRSYNKKVLNSISLTEKGMSISIEILIKAREKGFIIKEVPITCRYHSDSHSINPIFHGLSVAFFVVKLRLKTALDRIYK